MHLISLAPQLQQSLPVGLVERDAGQPDTGALVALGKERRLVGVDEDDGDRSCPGRAASLLGEGDDSSADDRDVALDLLRVLDGAVGQRRIAQHGSAMEARARAEHGVDPLERGLILHGARGTRWLRHRGGGGGGGCHSRARALPSCHLGSAPVGAVDERQAREVAEDVLRIHSDGYVTPGRGRRVHPELEDAALVVQQVDLLVHGGTSRVKDEDGLVDMPEG
mmetsp:Transcript_3477/g.8512  ORF Transcript_3477/g.8512 Transcript_3477/m.8512 type:complete len:223 (-) Transcript_3477:2360-3028(-)